MSLSELFVVFLHRYINWRLSLSFGSLCAVVRGVLGTGNGDDEVAARGANQHLLRDVGEADRTQALERFFILRPCLENGVPLAQLSREHALQLRTLQRWVRAYHQKGLLGLVRTSRADRGERRRVSADLQQLIEAFALRRPPLSCAAVHRDICAIARARGWREPTYATVYSVLDDYGEPTSFAAKPPARRTQDYVSVVRRRSADPRLQSELMP